MGGITTGVGIFSGVNSAQLIEQLLAIDARPRTFAQRRIVQLQQQQAAYLDVNSALLGLKTAASAFDRDNIFDSTKATSSNPDVLAATASTTAVPGTYNLLVHRLVTTQQTLSRGFVDGDVSGIGASSFTFELGGGSLGTDTKLAELNGGDGVERGKIQVTDSTGTTATVDLSRAVTIGEVIDAINLTTGVNVNASIDGDRLVIEDAAGGAGTLTIANAFGSETADSLGIAGSAVAGVLTGANIRNVSESTALSLLNDGNGVHIRDGSADLVITARDGTILNIDLGTITQSTTDPETGEPVTTTLQTRAATLGDVIDIINGAAEAANAGAGIDFTASLNAEGTGLTITDNTGGGGNLIIQGGTGRTTAKDLGIETDVAGVAASTVAGKRLISGLNSTLVRNLNGGAGLGALDLAVTDRSGASFTVNLSATTPDGSVAGLIDEINTALAANGVDVSVRLNKAGNGLEAIDRSGGNGNLIIGGGAADDLGLETAGVAANSFNGTNAQLKWISLGTQVSSLNQGRGIGTGQFRITDASGTTSLVEVGTSIKTVDDLIQLINSRPTSVTASINSTGDGILLTDESGGSNTLKIEDVSGTVAKSLNLVGEDTDDSDGLTLNGSYEREVTFETTDTLKQVVEKINLAGVGVTASIINDGSSSSPFRISFSSKFSGSKGRAIVDTKGFDLGLTTLAKGDDAVVFFGSSDPAKAVLLTSQTNTFDKVITGVSIDAQATSDEPVEVVVTRDTENIEKSVTGFVDAFNKVLDTIKRYDVYNAETETRGVLLGDNTVSSIRASLFRFIQGTPDGVEGSFQRLFQVGVRIGAGAKLEFDRDKFREALEADPQNVEDLFAANRLAPREPIEVAPGITVTNTGDDEFLQLGVAEQIELLIENLTNSVDGTLTRRGQSLDSQIELQNRRIDSINASLEVKRTKLQRQFTAMEQTIAQLQSQSSALQSIQLLG